jgi:hypothetical protein
MTTIYNNKYDIDGEAVDDQSGYSVSMNSTGDIVAIGAINNDAAGNNSGHVRVYKQTDGKWEQLGIDIDGEAVGDQSGYSVSMNSAGDIVAIGAINNNGGGSNSGHVRVYQYIATPDGLKPKAWIQLGIDIDGEAAGDNSGTSVSMNSTGDIVAISAIFNNGVDGSNSGHVRVYQYIATPDGLKPKAWIQLGIDIDGEAANDQSGLEISMNSAGDIVAISSMINADVGANAGHVRVYQYIDTPDGLKPKAWIQLGIDIDGRSSHDYSGTSVSMNSAGDIVAIGAERSEPTGLNSTGHVRVWKYDGSAWQRLGDDIYGEASFDYSGTAISMNSAGDIVSICSIENDSNSANAGHVRVWKLIADKWERLGLDIYGEAAGDNSGYSVSMNNAGDIVSIGSINNDGNGDKSGHTRVFYYRNNAWNQAPPGFFKVSDNGVFTISDTGLFTVQ